MMNNTNTSGFTYRESGLGNNIGTNQYPNSQIYPPQRQSTFGGSQGIQGGPIYTTQFQQQQPYLTNNSQLMPPAGLNYPQSHIMTDNRSMIANSRPILLQERLIAPPIQQVQQQSVVHEVIQPKVIEETVVHHSRVNERVGSYESNYSHHYDPEVETVRDSQWMSYYDGRKQLIPPPLAGKYESKNACKLPILILLGLLALAGLITAIVLGSKASGMGGVQVNNMDSSNGVRMNPNQETVTVAQEKNGITANSSSSSTTTQNQNTANKTSGSTIIAPVIVSPSASSSNTNTTTTTTTTHPPTSTTITSTGVPPQRYYEQVQPIIVDPTRVHEMRLRKHQSAV